MKRWGKAVLFYLLLSALLLSLAAGCEKAGEQDSGGTAIRYTARHCPLEYREPIQTACFLENRLIYDSMTSAILTVKSDPDSPIRREPRAQEYSFQTLFSAGVDGGEAAELTAFTGFQIECTQDGARWHNIRQIAAAPDGTLRLLTRRQGEWSDAGWPAHLLILDSDGQVRQDLFLENHEFLGSRQALACDTAGNTYLYDDGYQSGTTVVVSPQGGIVGTLSGKLQGGLAPLADGRVAGLVMEDDLSRWSVRAIDPDRLSFVNCGTIPLVVMGAQSFFRGGGEYDLLCATDLSLCGYKLAREGQAGSGELLLSWLNCDIDGSGTLAVIPREEGYACAAYSEAYGGETVLLQRQEGPAGEDTVVTLACRNLPSAISRAVLQFNRKDNGFRVEIRDYGEISLSKGLAAGLDQMTADLISGKAPDLFCLENLDVQSLIDRELLEDLWPYIDADAGLGGREALVQPLFDALTQKGKLYQITYGFYLNTLMGRADLVGDKMGWTVEEFRALCAASDCEFYVDDYWNCREGVLSRLLMTSYDQFIDREGWTAGFDSPEFIALLECAALFPAENQDNGFLQQEARLQNGEQLLTEAGIFRPDEFVSQPIFTFGRAKTAFVGYPGAAGNGAVFHLYAPLGMCAQSKNKEAAWAFLRTLLLPENQRVNLKNSLFLPSNQTAMDSLLTSIREDYESRSASSGEDSEISGPAAVLEDGTLVPLHWNEQDIADFLAYLSGVRAVYQQEDAIEAIVMDEAARYFTGDQTAGAAAKAIQSRVNLYLGERKR